MPPPQFVVPFTTIIVCYSRIMCRLRERSAAGKPGTRSDVYSRWLYVVLVIFSRATGFARGGSENTVINWYIHSLTDWLLIFQKLSIPPKGGQPKLVCMGASTMIVTELMENNQCCLLIGNGESVKMNSYSNNTNKNWAHSNIGLCYWYLQMKRIILGSLKKTRRGRPRW